MLVRGGWVDPGSDLDRAGSYGYYWASVVHSSSFAYNLIFHSNSVIPSDFFSRYDGFSIRCVALGG